MKYPISKRALKIALLSSVMVAPIMASQSALAQDDDDDNSLEVIVVTATKRETNLMDTPLAISAFTEDSLDKLGIKNIKDLNNLVPNMSIMVDVESNAPIITMRGVRSTNTTEWGDPAVGIHIDGVYSPRPQGALALMFDIERAEVMRGPQGTLFGRNSTVGSVNIISKKPDFDGFSGKVQAEYGRWNQRALKAAINIPVSDTFALRTSFVVAKQDSNMTGFWDPNQWDQRYLQEMGLTYTPTDVAPGPATNDWNNRNFFRDTLYEPVPVDDYSSFYNSVNNYAFRLSGYWKPSDDLSVLLTFERFRDDSAGGLNARDCERIANRDVTENGGSCTDIWGNENNYETYVNVPGVNDMTQDSFRARMEYNVTDNMQFVYIGGFTSQERKGQIDLDQGFYLWDQMLKWVDTDYDSWNHEVQLKSTGAGKLEWIAGYFNFSENNDMDGQYHGAMGGVSAWLQPKRTVDSQAIFAQTTYELNEKLFLTVGGRYTKDTKEDQGGKNWGCWDPACYTDVAWAEVWDTIDWGNLGNDATISADPLNVNGTNTVRARLNNLPSDFYDVVDTALWNEDTTNDVKNSWEKFTWRIGLDYDLSDNTMIYAYAANGYKSGGIGDVIYKRSDPTQKVDTAYDEETVITYELGAKASLLDGTMHLRANAFYSDFKGYQLTAMETVDVYPEFELDTDTMELVEVQRELRTFLTRNVGASKIMGFELEMEWNAWENGHIGGYLTLQDTKFDTDYFKRWGTEPGQVFADYDESSTDLSKPWFGNIKGNDMAYSPEVSFTVNISHDFHFSNGGRLTPFLNVHWESSSYVGIDNVDRWNIAAADMNDVDLNVYSDKRDAWALANFSLHYEAPDEAWFVEGYINNLTNADVNWWQAYSGTTPMAAKARQTYGIRAGYNF